MLKFLPFLAFLLVTGVTLFRGQRVRAQSGVSAWAFRDARGGQRITGLAFALLVVALGVASLFVAAGDGAGPLLPAGAFLSAAGSAIVIAAQIQMGAAWRIGVRDHDAPLFVTAGLFRFSRNPIFVGMILMAAGVALAAQSLWVGGAAIAFAFVCAAQVRVEEAHLAREFGDAYAAFCRATPRWLIV
jgi:protein-S-isoprenylcysteine O-methyltransferase Ste14